VTRDRGVDISLVGVLHAGFLHASRRLHETPLRGRMLRMEQCLVSSQPKHYTHEQADGEW
jgi:hypothetical protein